VQFIAALGLIILTDGPEALAQIAAVPSAVEGLVQLLDSSDKRVQKEIAWAIRDLGDSAALQSQLSNAPGLMDRLQQLMDSSAGDVQHAAAFALHKLAATSTALQPRVGAAASATVMRANFSYTRQLQEAVRQQDVAGSADAVWHGSSHLQSGKDSCGSKCSCHS
jgi:hypothetical protein